MALSFTGVPVRPWPCSPVLVPPQTTCSSSRLSQDAVNVEMTAVTASGVPGLKATFRFGGLGRYGEIYAFESMGHGFAASFTSGPGCEPADFPLLEAAAFDHAVQSLSIDP